MDDYDYMENYFSGAISPEEMKRFDEKIQNDPAFAEDVAFYCISVQEIKNQVAEEKKKRFKEIYNQLPAINNAGKVIKLPVRKSLSFIAAAAVFILAIASYLFFKPVSPVQLADKYIGATFKTLPVG